MNLAQFAINNSKVTYFATLLIVLGGLAAFFGLGQLEDPEFTVKTAVVATAYPGASAKEVELEITDRIELALQEMSQIKNLSSFSRAGYSQISVEIKPFYSPTEMPQIWDELRRKVRDVESSLPPGAGRPNVGDDFGQVFGFQIALIGDGYSYDELDSYAKELKKELSLVDDIARVELWGRQTKAIYLDVSKAQLSQLGISEATITQAINNVGLVTDAGSLNSTTNRLRIAPSGNFQTVEDIGNIVISPSVIDLLQNDSGLKRQSGSGAAIKLKDFATVRRGFVEPTNTMMRLDGRQSIGISITNVSGSNAVDVGKALDVRVDELIATLPVGIEIEKIHWQSEIVDEAVNSFLINFAQAVGIVIIVLTIGMGWRMSLLIGTALVVTILGSFILMKIFNIDLQRMSLGALVIALGMMVDNAIVVADGYVIRLQQGVEKKKAAIEAAQTPSLPLLGATVIAVLAFYPIFASDEGAGEYCRTLFLVVAISLLFSWLVSVTLTPLQCMAMIKAPDTGENSDPFAGKFYIGFRKLLRILMKGKYVVIVAMLGLLVVSGVGFGNVKQLFFPDSSMTKFMIDYWAPEGTRIETVSNDIKKAEAFIMADKRVINVASYIGSGPPRFYLPVEPEPLYQSYAQLIVNVRDFREIPAYVAELNTQFQEHYDQANVSIRPFGVGPSDTWKFELRVSSPPDATDDELRQVSALYEDIVGASPYAGLVRTNWREMVQDVVPEFDQEKGRWVNISRADVANSTKLSFDGKTLGLFREEDELIPIIMRPEESDRLNVGGLDILNVTSQTSTNSAPLSQVTNGINLEWINPLRWRRDRLRTITIQSNPIPGTTLPTFRADVIAAIDAVELPPGYKVEWGGEAESSADSQASLVPGMIPAAVVIIFIIVALFNAYKPPIIIILTIPFALIGVTAGLLMFNTPFGFLALLGGMSLAGMMVKNAIVLLDQAVIEFEDGKDRHTAIIEAAVSRLRPVLLAAATTVLGVVPLLQDVFWVGLAVTVMAGLTFGTALTMLLVPVLYSIFYTPKTKSEKN